MCFCTAKQKILVTFTRIKINVFVVDFVNNKKNQNSLHMKDKDSCRFYTLFSRTVEFSLITVVFILHSLFCRCECMCVCVCLCSFLWALRV